MFKAGILVWLFLLQFLAISTIDLWWPSLQRDFSFFNDISSANGLFALTLINALLLFGVVGGDAIDYFSRLLARRGKAGELAHNPTLSQADLTRRCGG